MPTILKKTNESRYRKANFYILTNHTNYLELEDEFELFRIYTRLQLKNNDHMLHFVKK